MADESTHGHGVESRTIALVAAIVLGIAAVLTAWSSYREALTSDEVLKNYSEQQATIAAANDAYAQADQQSGIENQFFVSYAVAAAEGNTGALTALAATMNPALFTAIEWWIDQPKKDGEDTPFVPENPSYAELPSQQLTAEGDALMDQAELERAAAEEADVVSDRFGLANVFFAVVLFLAGVATLLQRRSLQVGILGLGLVMLGVGFVILATTPGWASIS